MGKGMDIKAFVEIMILEIHLLKSIFRFLLLLQSTRRGFSGVHKNVGKPELRQNPSSVNTKKF